ncbi:MAG: hypothetical protein H6710_08190 [Myxococcales bacterium]|nr:hypothetical protein [Myxococcales bacterium]
MSPEILGHLAPLAILGLWSLLLTGLARWRAALWPGPPPGDRPRRRRPGGPRRPRAPRRSRRSTAASSSWTAGSSSITSPPSPTSWSSPP